MRALGFEAKKSDVLQILKDYDRQNTGRIGFTDFSDVSKFFIIENHFVNLPLTRSIA